VDQGQSPFTTPFENLRQFQELFHVPVRESLHQVVHAALEAVAGFDPNDPALIAPVELTLHRAPRLVLPNSSPNIASIWLLGDAAVGLPVSKGCNLVYHMAAAGKLARSLLDGAPADYEDFVYKAWDSEAWNMRGSFGSTPASAIARAFGSAPGRFTK